MSQIIDENLKSEIVESLGISDLTSFEREAIISDLEEKIISQLNSIILDRLDDAEKEELETLVEDEEISSFLQRSIPDLEEVKKEAAIWVVKNWREEFVKSKASDPNTSQ
ncbi:MAG TPA: hypothetical protein P5274_00740 [Candidatus Paceibacterota bacterium]|nr:hypothetical protein [Candidatus Paceibacterota bacterium]